MWGGRETSQSACRVMASSRRQNALIWLQIFDHIGLAQIRGTDLQGL